MTSTAAVERHTLLEREQALETLREALARAGTGHGSVVVVSGEAGIGKTALLHAFCTGSCGDAQVLWGACDPLFTPRPLGPLHDIGHSGRDELLEVLRGEAVPFDVGMSLLRELERHAPTVLVLEDLHWADQATLDVVRIVARRVEDVPTVVLATFRDDGLEATHPLRMVLGELGTSRAVDRIRLSRLTYDAVARLAAPAGIDPDELYRVTGGNPFFVTEALASGGETMPETIRDAVLGRVARLSAEARELLEAIATSPRAAELWLLEELSGNGGIAALDECLASGVLTSAPEDVAFTHELGRLAVEGSLPPARRLDLHRRILAALSARPVAPEDLARLAHHAEGAGDEAAALELGSAAAAHASAHGAHREAAAQYARAIRFAGGLPPGERAALLNRYSFECYLTAQDVPALQAIEDALDCYRELGSELGLGATLRWQGLANLNWGRTDEARDSVREAVAVLERLEPGAELALSYGTLAAIATLDEDSAEAVRWCERALDLADRVDSDEARASALGTLGLNEVLLGSRTGFALLEKAISLGRGAGLENQVGRTYAFLAMAASRERSLTRMRVAVSEGLDYCEQRDLDAWDDLLVATRAWLELEEGAWDDASATVAQVLSRNCVLSSAQVNIVLGLLRARRGDPDPWAPLDAATPIAERTGSLWWTFQVAAARAEAAWLEGRHDGVEEATAAAYAAALELRAPWPMAELAVWRRRAGVAVEVPNGAYGPFADQLRGDWSAAAAAWHEAGCPYEAALALADGDEDAQRRSLAALTALGARPAADLVARRLRERGVRGIPRGPRPTTQQSPAGLTARETEVLRLLAQGLRNREIADRLVLSQRTVDHHVSAVLRKLGVETRGGAAAEAARLGLLQDP